MRLTAQLDDPQAFGRYTRALADRLGVSLPVVVKNEAAAVVRWAMRHTKSQAVARLRDLAIKQSFSEFQSGRGEVTVGFGRRAKHRRLIWYRHAGSDKVRPIGRWDGPTAPTSSGGAPWHHLRDSDWAAVRAAWAKQRVAATKEAKAAQGARGLTAKSWLEIIDKLKGSPADAPGYVRGARPKSGSSRGVAAMVENNMQGAYAVEIANTSGLAVASGGAEKLAAGLAVRRAFFERALTRGFLDDAKFLERYFPWARVGA